MSSIFHANTPGPWFRTRAASKQSEDIGVFGKTLIHGNPRYICRVYGEGVLSPQTEEREANIALIVSAPDLRNMLEEARNELAFIDDNHLTARNLAPLVERINATLEASRKI